MKISKLFFAPKEDKPGEAEICSLLRLAGCTVAPRWSRPKPQSSPEPHVLLPSTAWKLNCHVHTLSFIFLKQLLLI